MLKKNLLYIIFLGNISCTFAQTSLNNVGFKTQQLYDLQSVAEKINRLKPLGNYRVAIPPFVTLRSIDVEHFLAGIPSGIEEKRGRKKYKLSMLDYIKKLWANVVLETRAYKEITLKAREDLIAIRAAIQTAFQHDIASGKIDSAIQSFLERSQRQKNNLIVRSSTKQPLFGAKSVYPIAARNINAGIAQVLISYFNEDTIAQMMSYRLLDNTLHLEVILQSMIMEDTNANGLVVSGVSCSYDNTSNIPHIVSIESAFGHSQGIKDASVALDRFYVHDDMVYPVIAKKINRLIPDFDMMHARMVPNTHNLQEKPTLDVQAAKEIARAAQLLEELYDNSVCVHFIKRDNTIYLVKIQIPELEQAALPSSFDQLYTKKLKNEHTVAITPVLPFHELIVVKKRKKIILAPHARKFLELLEKREDKDEIVLGILKERPATWSKEVELLALTKKPIIWSSDFETLRMWIDQNSWPLVFDIQQKIAFPFKRCRGFCTLFQAIETGIKTHPVAEQVSTLPTFFPEINNVEREALKPDEFFSGVPFEHLFDLLKFGSLETATQALKTALFRLNNIIVHGQITKKECELNEQPFEDAQLIQKQQLYQYIERVAYQLLKQLQQWDRSNKKPADDLEKIFLINMLHALIDQQPNEQIVQNSSFNEANKQ
ncbi:MAG: PEP/pyruvate-binding domain-containing protein [Candidatus Dependentiae bacterium]